MYMYVYVYIALKCRGTAYDIYNGTCLKYQMHIEYVKDMPFNHNVGTGETEVVFRVQVCIYWWYSASAMIKDYV